MLSVVIYCTREPFEGPPAEAEGPVSPLGSLHLFIHPTQDDTHDSLDFDLMDFNEIQQYQLFLIQRVLKLLFKSLISQFTKKNEQPG